MKKDYVSISMVRQNLKGIPQYALPQGFSFKWYRPGDESLWLEIHARAD